MRTLFLNILLTLALAVSAFAQPEKVNFNADWLFHKGSLKDAPLKHDFDDNQWEKVDLPHTYNDQDIIDDPIGYYRGEAWYRKKFEVPTDWRHKKVSLNFEGVAIKCEIYVNDRYVGEHLGGYTAFYKDIEGLLNFGEENQLAIKTDNSENLQFTTPPVAGDFSMFGGIHRNVFLVTKNKLYFDHNFYGASGVFFQNTGLKNNKAQFNISTHYRQELPFDRQVIFRHQILNKNQKVIWKTAVTKRTHSGDISHWETDSKVNNIQPWSIDNPYLYTLKSQIIDAKDNKVIDEIEQKIGFRTVSISQQKGVLLNNKPIKLQGVARHQQYHHQGSALTDDQHQKDMVLAKDLGSNFVRISHYPHSPEIYKACDSLGMVSWSEIPCVNWVPFGQPFLDNSRTMMREMIYQNYNHPSVIIWGYHNEIWQAHEEAVLHAKAMEQISKQTDPSRLTAMAFQGTFLKNYVGELGEEIFNVSDINGFNVYQGWYQDTYKTIDHYVDSLKTYSPKKCIMLSEFGAGADPRIWSAKPSIHDFSNRYQVDFLKPYLATLHDSPWMVGYSIWILNDFERDSRKDAVPNVNNKGLISTDRQPKDAYYFVQANWSKKPMVYIEGAPMDTVVAVTEGNTFTVKLHVYGNGNKVKLRHNKQFFYELELKQREVEFDIDLQKGWNKIEAIDERNNCRYERKIFLKRVKSNSQGIEIPKEGLAINIGQTDRYFNGNERWLPASVFNENPNFKVLGGNIYHQAYKDKPALRLREGISENVFNSTDDPMYQTFRWGIEALNLKLKSGKYKLTFYWAYPFKAQKNRPLSQAEIAWGEQDGSVATTEDIFNLRINGSVDLSKLNVRKEAGNLKALEKEVICQTDKNGQIGIQLEALSGQAFLNGIKITPVE
ncbi:glycoside hydrolase family 2 TIM barrel-domain containing protein [Persicobacter psychrovividus]|uniref:Beta-galactosidase n=1 Tax=Persicobacter psychrovividus TaxID=387638 RepID=A0ABN6LDI5_9BACT|nr:beta-galactosidase [Persicobacter psychrovividus]